MKANMEEDFLSFHGKVVSDSKDPQITRSPLAASRLLNNKGVNRTNGSNKAEPMAVVGSASQNLLCLPGEEDSVYAPSEEIQRQSIRQALQKRFLVSPQNGAQS